MSFDDICFISKPNFRFKEIVSNKSDCLSASYQFDCYKDKNDEIILITPFFDYANILKQEYYISLLNLKNNKLITKLEGHKDRITTVRYFQDPSTKNDYLISADKKFNIIVWELSNKYQKIFEIKYEYQQFIYSCLLIFDQKKIWAVLSSVGDNNITISININNVKEIIEIEDSKGLKVYFLTYWYNNEALEKEQKHNIIQCGLKQILISEFQMNNTYFSFETDEKYPLNLGGIVFKNNNRDMLAVSSSYGMVQILDLATKILIKNIKFENVHLYSFVKWNENYLLLNDCLQRKIIVFDMKNDYEIKSRVLCPEMYFDRFIKKVDHPIYGESILSVGTDWKIKLFITRDIYSNKQKRK